MPVFFIKKTVLFIVVLGSVFPLQNVSAKTLVFDLQNALATFSMYVLLDSIESDH